MEIDVLLSAIGSVGFPIVVAGYALTKLNKTMERMTEVMVAVATALKVQIPGDK